MSEIKPCPFCGGPAERGEADDGGKFISCTQCFASSALHYDRAENLDSNWNRRDESALTQARAEERERCAKYKDGLTESMKAIDSMQKRHSAYRASTEKGIGLARLYLNAGETMRAIKALNDACDQMDEADRIRALSDEQAMEGKV